MNVPDELRTLYVAAAEMAVLEGVDLGEIDDIALAAVLDRHEQMCLAKWLKQLPAAAKGHWPSVASRYDGTWGVFCVACSAEAGDYAACKLGRGDWPPAVLADPAQVRAKVAEEVEPILKDLRKAARTHHYLIACEQADAALARLRAQIRGGQ